MRERLKVPAGFRAVTEVHHGVGDQGGVAWVSNPVSVLLSRVFILADFSPLVPERNALIGAANPIGQRG